MRFKSRAHQADCTDGVTGLQEAVHADPTQPTASAGTVEDRKALFWAADALDVFFLQVQGSGQVELPDGSRVRVGYADQNGHPYASIGRWLVDQGELKLEQASMQGIREWARANPSRVPALLAANPSYVFFRELPIGKQAPGLPEGPLGALGVPIAGGRVVAVDPRAVPLGAPVWLSTTRPNSSQPLRRLMMAQDTGGAIKGIIVVEISGPSVSTMMGIVVDSVSEVVQIRGDDIEETPKFGAKLDTEYILGMAKTEGHVKILLDIDRVLTADELSLALKAA